MHFMMHYAHYYKPAVYSIWYNKSYLILKLFIKFILLKICIKHETVCIFQYLCLILMHLMMYYLENDH